MTIVVEKVMDLFLSLDSIDKNFLGGIPHSINIERQLNNYKLYLKNGLPTRSRVNIGKVLIEDDMVLGYSSFTVIKNANPTIYEKEFIGLDGKLNYLQFKGLLINPDFREQGLGLEFGKYRLGIAEKLELPVVCDIKVANEKNYKLLKKQGFKESFNWKNQKGTAMIRFLRE